MFFLNKLNKFIKKNYMLILVFIALLFCGYMFFKQVKEGFEGDKEYVVDDVDISFKYNGNGPYYLTNHTYNKKDYVTFKNKKTPNEKISIVDDRIKLNDRFLTLKGTDSGGPHEYRKGKYNYDYFDVTYGTKENSPRISFSPTLAISVNNTVYYLNWTTDTSIREELYPNDTSGKYVPQWRTKYNNGTNDITGEKFNINKLDDIIKTARAAKKAAATKPTTTATKPTTTPTTTATTAATTTAATTTATTIGRALATTASGKPTKPADKVPLNQIASEPLKYKYEHDLNQVDCIEKCLDEKEYSDSVCIESCAEYNKNRFQRLEQCHFRPYGLTTGRCQEHCEEYYNLFGFKNDEDKKLCSSDCKNVCDSCKNGDCKWTQFSKDDTFPYELVVSGISGNNRVVLLWEKPEFLVEQYIIMYFEKEMERNSGVNIIKIRPGDTNLKLNTDENMYEFTIDRLANNKTYVFGVSVQMNNKALTRMSNRLVLTPNIISAEINQTEEEPSNNNVVKLSRSEIFEQGIQEQWRKSSTQDIMNKFVKEEQESVRSLFEYLAKSPLEIDLRFS